MADSEISPEMQDRAPISSATEDSETASVLSKPDDIPASQLSGEPNDHDASLAACIVTAQHNREQRLKTQRQRALKSVAKYNTQLNQQRVAERKSYFDLQTNLVHVPRRTVQVLPTDSELYRMQLFESQHGTGPYKRPGTLLEHDGANLFARKTGAYPAALMFSPPQYSDRVPVFSPDELGYLPLNSAIHTAPPYAVHCLNMSAEEFRKMRGFDGKEATDMMSDDDSDAEGPNDVEMAEKGTASVKSPEMTDLPKVIPVTPTKVSDRRSSVTTGRERASVSEAKSIAKSPEKTEVPVSGTVIFPVDIPIPACPPNTCHVCHFRPYQPPPAEPVKQPKKRRGKKPPPEPTADDLAKEKMIVCSKCPKKTHPSCMQMTKSTLFAIQKYSWQCSDCKVCLKCRSAGQEEKLMFCDFCDRGYHNFCVGVQRIPNGRWLCLQCAVCSICGATRSNVGGKRGRACIWQSDWDEDNSGKVTAIRTLCYPCYKEKKGAVADEEEAGGDEDAKDDQA